MASFLTGGMNKIEPIIDIDDACEGFGYVEHTVSSMVDLYNPHLKAFGVRLQGNFLGRRKDNANGFVNLYKSKMPHPCFVTEKLAADTCKFIAAIENSPDYVVPMTKEPKAGKSRNIIHFFLGCAIYSVMDLLIRGSRRLYLPIALLTPRNEGVEQFRDEIRLLDLTMYLDLVRGDRPYPLSEVVGMWQSVLFKCGLKEHYIKSGERMAAENVHKIVDFSLQNGSIIPAFFHDEGDEGSGKDQLFDRIFSHPIRGEDTYHHMAKRRVIYGPISATNKVIFSQFPGWTIKLEEEDYYRHIKDVPRHRIRDLDLSPESQINYRMVTHTISPKSHPLSNVTNFVKVRYGAQSNGIYKSHFDAEYRNFVDVKYPNTIADILRQVDRLTVYEDGEKHCLISWRGITKNDNVILLAEQLRKVLGDKALVIPYCRGVDEKYGRNWLKQYHKPELAVEELYRLEGAPLYSKMTILLLSNSGRRTMEFPDNHAMVLCNGEPTTETTLEQECGRTAGNFRNNTYLFLSDKMYDSLEGSILGCPTQSYSLHAYGKRNGARREKLAMDLHSHMVSSVRDGPSRAILEGLFEKIDKFVLNQPYQMELIVRAMRKHKNNGSTGANPLAFIMRGGEEWYEKNPGVNLLNIFTDKVFSTIESCQNDLLSNNLKDSQIEMLRIGEEDAEGRSYKCKIGDGGAIFPKKGRVYPFIGIRSREMNQGGSQTNDRIHGDKKSANLAPYENKEGHKKLVILQIWYDFNYDSGDMKCVRITFGCKSGSHVTVHELEPKEGSIPDKLVNASREVRGDGYDKF